MVDDLVEVRVTFEFPAGKDGNPPAYRDALYFSQDDYAASTPETLAAAKQERYDNWLAVVTAPAPEPEPAAPQSQDDVASQAAEIATAAAALAQQAADLAAANQPAVADGGT